MPRREASEAGIRPSAVGMFESTETIDGVEGEQVTRVEFTPDEIGDMVAHNGGNEDELNRTLEAANTWNMAPIEERRRFLSGNFDEDAERDNPVFAAYQELTILSKVGDNIPLIGNKSEVLRASKLILIHKANELEHKDRIDDYETIRDPNDLRDIHVSPEWLRIFTRRDTLSQWDLNEIYYAVGVYNRLSEDDRRAVLSGTMNYEGNDALKQQIKVLEDNNLISVAEPGSRLDRKAA
jgi:hypothetical protein